MICMELLEGRELLAATIPENINQSRMRGRRSYNQKLWIVTRQ